MEIYYATSNNLLFSSTLFIGTALLLSHLFSLNPFAQTLFMFFSTFLYFSIHFYSFWYTGNKSSIDDIQSIVRSNTIENGQPGELTKGRRGWKRDKRGERYIYTGREVGDIYRENERENER